MMTCEWCSSTDLNLRELKELKDSGSNHDEEENTNTNILTFAY